MRNDVIYSKKSDRKVFDEILQQEVILYDTPLRKQIFVDPGIRVNRFTADENVSLAEGPLNGPGGNFSKFISTFNQILKTFLSIKSLCEANLKMEMWSAQLGPWSLLPLDVSSFWS